MTWVLKSKGCATTTPTAVNLLGGQQKQELTTLLDEFIGRVLFPVNPESVPIYLDSELSLPLVGESQAPVAEKQRGFFPARNANDS